MSVVPNAFRARRSLELFNLVAVGASLAAATAATFTSIFSDGKVAYFTAIPTLLVGMLWVWLLRMPNTVGKSSLRLGWLLSIPLAAFNGALGGGLLLAFDRPMASFERFLLGGFLGATFGAIFWVPALIATLLLFGTPLASAQRLAKQGLAGQERGERIVGATSAVIALLAMVWAATSQQHLHGTWLTMLCALLGMVFGGAAAAGSFAREKARQQFVAEVEAGKVEHFRVEQSAEGKVLLRVVSQGEGYRVADYEEEIAALNAEGAVTRAARS